MLHCHPHTGFWLCLLNHTEKQVDFFLPKNNLSRIWKQWFHFLIRASKTGSFNPSSKNKISRPLSILPPLHMLCSVHVALIVPNLELAAAYHWYHPQSIQDYCVFFSSIFPRAVLWVGINTVAEVTSRVCLADICTGDRRRRTLERPPSTSREEGGTFVSQMVRRGLWMQICQNVPSCGSSR